MIAERAAQLDAAKKQNRLLDASESKKAAAELRGENVAFRDWFAAVDGLIAEALRMAGWHRVRWQWRQQRGMIVSSLATVGHLPRVSAELVARAGRIDPATADQAAKEDRAALKEVDEYLDHPAARAL